MRQPDMRLRRLAAPVAAAVLLCLAVGSALAASPFGVGLAEPTASGGLFGPLLAKIAVWQSQFYLALKTAIATPGGGLTLVALSFGYGVFHAIGPGHGKAVVSAYVLANRETARNAAMIGLLSGLAQGVCAVALVSVVAIALGATSIAMTRIAALFEIGSFALVAALGLWLVWRKVVRPLALRVLQPATPVFSAVSGGEMTASRTAGEAAFSGVSLRRAGPASGAGAMAGAGFGTGSRAGSSVGGGFSCNDGHGIDCDCGGHVPPPEAMAGPLGLAKAWSAILAVGLRPCTGALIVLVFAMSQKVYLLGVAAVFAMALGTGATVAAMVLGAVGLRGAVNRASGRRGRWLRLFHHGLEGAGAIAVFAFGALMLAGSLAAGR
ncbi:nickel/cobalt transporter [Methylobrevis pamukkalensis]|uniref:Nickel/cobalt efflux system n=1 Tax=Methylobrevis pamukkalensis TaxID=1439726 RepID=A0A1E3GY87_9HYPH|nr:nickel/cobalt transporter [Methylobrevis pamukkalensis]ODN69003.1 nickel/cobalt efflux protein RcnA [Methylobrevis pamukkalensis]